MTRKKHTYGLRLRTRGGAAIQKRWTRIMIVLKAPHSCPSCASLKVAREAVGIWECRKCGYRFAGGAYVPITKTGLASKRVPNPA
ncbi:MAG: 50S ribosomal protein L37ae [Candidatus Bathyarchaeota archaeon]|nr:50S ribosomal protein L37ae [Candidatus Bathyarchaeota archaeon]